MIYQMGFAVAKFQAFKIFCINDKEDHQAGYNWSFSISSDDTCNTRDCKRNYRNQCYWNVSFIFHLHNFWSLFGHVAWSEKGTFQEMKKMVLRRNLCRIGSLGSVRALKHLDLLKLGF